MAFLPCLLLLFLIMTSSHLSLLRSGSALTNVTCYANDLASLRSIARSFPAGDFSDWDAAEDDCCAWKGDSITCSEPLFLLGGDAVFTRRVTGLHLNSQLRNLNLRPIPPSVCSLSALTTLRLAGRNTGNTGFTGSIPACIGSNLTRLVHLDLSFNSLTGSIPPSLSHLHELVYLYLTYNRLSGPLLASSLPSSGHLSGLRLSANAFSGATFLSGLAGNTGLNFANLSNLDLSSNAFSGPIPSFNRTPRLTELDLSSNSFSGSVSSVFTSPLPSGLITTLDLSSNSLSGEIPSFLHPSFASLEYLRLENNLLNGSLPPSLCRLPYLQTLSLSSNAFSGHLSELCREVRPHFTQITDLELSNNQFVGDFPDWIGSLTSLETLDLSYNSFNGSLPDSWRRLGSSSDVDFQLYLSGNSLLAPPPSNVPGTSRLPSWLFSIPGMTVLSLSAMGLQDTDLDCYSASDGTLLFNTSGNLDAVDLSGNNFTASVLGCISRYLTFNSSSASPSLNLSGNPLSLNLDLAEAVNLLPASLEALDLSFCQISGHLTDRFFERITPSIMDLALAHNQLAGEVPAHLGNLSNLGFLDLSYNSFTGFAPLERTLGSLTVLQVSNNALAGNLSTLFLNVLNVTSVCGAEPSLWRLDLSHNDLQGEIPSLLGHCLSHGADRLKLNDNNLEGFLPTDLAPNTGTRPPLLQILSLGNNRFTGPIPASYAHLTELVLLDLGHNRLHGSLESISLFVNASSNQFPGLRVLLLGHNEFTGLVPDSLGLIAPALQLIDFSNNMLQGPLPVRALQGLRAFTEGNTRGIPGLNITVRGTLYEELRINVKGSYETYKYVLAALTSLDLSGNNMSGQIPAQIGKLKGLVALNLSRNSLSGEIPAEIEQLAEQLQVLDLSFNELAGAIPRGFQGLTRLEVFNVSYNKGLKGPIPRSQPQFEMAESYYGDPELCGDPVLRACETLLPPMSPTPANAEQEEAANAVTEWMREWIAIPGLCLGYVVGFFVTVYASFHLRLLGLS